MPRIVNDTPSCGSRRREKRDSRGPTGTDSMPSNSAYKGKQRPIYVSVKRETSVVKLSEEKSITYGVERENGELIVRATIFRVRQVGLRVPAERKCVGILLKKILGVNVKYLFALP